LTSLNIIEYVSMLAVAVCMACRHSLRLASQHKVQALLAFPDDDGEGHDGVVAWAAHRNIKLVNLSSQVSRFTKCFWLDVLKQCSSFVMYLRCSSARC
jgi:hypothetical protein